MLNAPNAMQTLASRHITGTRLVFGNPSSNRLLGQRGMEAHTGPPVRLSFIWFSARSARHY